MRDFVRAFHATSEGGGSSGHSTSEVYRLDDFWAVQITSDDNGTIRLVGTAQPSVRHLWVAPPPHFTGRWVTYFTNGIASHDIAFRDGAYERFRAFHDNGQLAYEQRYVNGQIDGDETGFDRDGHTSYAIHHAAGQNVGRWVHFYPTGRMQSEEHYVAGQLDGVSTRWRPDGSRDSISHYAHGQETGQAAWDEHGTLLYAHGTAASEVRDH